MKNFSLSETLKDAIHIAQSIAYENMHGNFSPSHLLKGLLHKNIGLSDILQDLNKDMPYINDWAEVRIEEYPKSAKPTSEPNGDDKIQRLFDEGDNIRLKLGLDEISPICIFTAICKPNLAFSADQLKTFPVKEKEILDLYLENSKLSSAVGLVSEQKKNGTKGQIHENLLKFTIDKISQVKEGKINPIIGRDREIKMITEVLSRKYKPNVLIIGDSGVGKTSTVDSLVHFCNNNIVPEALKGAFIFELDNGSLMAGASYKGEIEDRLKKIFNELRSFENSILVIDNIHLLLDPKSQNGASVSNFLKPVLSKGEFILIGITTVDEYRKTIEADATLSRFFEVVKIEEPEVNLAARMVSHVIPIYSQHYGLDAHTDAIPEAIRYAKRFFKERRLPDSAIDLIDRTFAAIKVKNDTSSKELEQLFTELETIKTSYQKNAHEFITELQWFYKAIKNRVSPVITGQLEENTEIAKYESADALYQYIFDYLSRIKEIASIPIDKIDKSHIASIVAFRTGIPIGKIQANEKDKLLNMPELLKKRVVGQDHAIKAITDAILESRSGLNKPGQPIGGFFLLGPTGTGKTELTKALAEFLFNDETAMIRFDMSEFKEEHSAALLYGAPPGYVGYEEGGLLVNKIRQKPYSVVLFDEIEKAHPSVFDVFLQLLDEGKIHDKLGKEGDFSNSIVFFTSNIGSDWITEKFLKGEIPKSNELLEMMAKYFRPEFLARLTEVIPFSPIMEEHVVKIFEIHLKGVLDLLNKQGIELSILEDAKKELAKKGYTPRYGARPITGIIRNHIRRPISKMIIRGEVKMGDCIKLSLNEQQEILWDIFSNK